MPIATARSVISMKEPIVAVNGQRGRVLGRFPRWTLAFTSLAIIVVVVLAIGLGVGLGTKGHQGNSSFPTPATSSPTPKPTGPPNNDANGTVWQPAPNSTWQIVLLDPIALDSGATSVQPDVEIFDLDLFTNSNATFQALHKLGKKVICYFSAGSYEPNRPDSSEFQAADIGNELDGWPGERWLDIRSDNVRSTMAARIKLASEKGCDAIDPDNVDGYDNDNGFDLTSDDSVNFVTYLSQQAALYKLGTGLKNAGDIIANVSTLVQFSVNEQCVQYEECETFTPFIEARKPVFHIEYPTGAPGKISTSAAAASCLNTGKDAGRYGFSTVLKNLNLDGWVEFCDRSTANTTMRSS